MIEEIFSYDVAFFNHEFLEKHLISSNIARCKIMKEPLITFILNMFWFFSVQHAPLSDLWNFH